MITVTTRTPTGVAEMYLVECDTWEEARDLIRKEFPANRVVLASVKPRGEPCPT